MQELFPAVMSVQHSSVLQFPRLLVDQMEVSTVNELPFGPTERRYFRADGEPELLEPQGVHADEAAGPNHLLVESRQQQSAEGYVRAIRPHLPLRNRHGDVVSEEEWDRERTAVAAGVWSQSISDTPSGASPEYRVPSHVRKLPGIDPDTVTALEKALPSQDFIKAICHDARDLVIGCAIHLCTKSCWKYHSKGVSHICRHNFYHVVTLFDEQTWEPVRRRGRGKDLRGCIAIMVDTRYGMAGRILTSQEQPFECGTNCAALVAARCNVDVQDMRRVFPPHLWLPSEELERDIVDDPSEATGLPQRFRGFSVGRKPEWGWMDELGTTEHANHAVLLVDDWSTYFTSTIAAGEAPDEESAFQRSAEQAALAMFIDAHNAGYYINT